MLVVKTALVLMAGIVAWLVFRGLKSLWDDSE